MSKALIGRGKPPVVLLAVQCGRKKKKEAGSPEHAAGVDERPADLFSGAQLEVNFLDSLKYNELKQKLESSRPEFLFILGEKGHTRSELGLLSLGDKLISVDNVQALFGPKLPEVVYLEAPSSGKLGEAVYAIGVRHVVVWRASVTCCVATHFRQAFISALRTPGCEPYDAFELACASLDMHCGSLRNRSDGSNQPLILGEPPPSLSEPPREMDDDSGTPLIQIFDEETELRLLVCAEASSSALEAVETGLASLLAIEVRGVRLIHRISAPPPPSAVNTFARGVIAMRCDLCTSSSARISLVVSGGAQTCFADQFLETTIKKALLEKSQAVQLVPAGDDTKAVEIRRSASIACGAGVVEIRLRVPSWAAQTLRQLGSDISYKVLAAMGVAGVEGAPVAAFLKEDADRLSLIRDEEDPSARCNGFNSTAVVPSWFSPAAPTRKRQSLCASGNSDVATSTSERPASLAAMKPIPHATRRKLMPFAGVVSAGAQAGWSIKLNGNTKSCRPEGTGTGTSGHGRGGHTFPLVLPVVKKHNCNRPSILECPEEEFLSDVVQFLVSRGHGRLIPPSGIESFPDVVLNGKRLDLYNLYREVVSRGGFRVGNGINWKGQIFSKMRNHTTTNRMTGVGNTLKKHYETYLLEYELAHDDVNGEECCIMCHSSAVGDWVNCGSCGEWAHFGCDRRTGLATFKEYAKTDGLEYICPRCSVGSAKGAPARKKQRLSGEGASPNLVSLRKKG